MQSLQSWWIYLIRGVLAIILGALLFTQRAQWNEVRYIGIFWLTIGLTNIAWARSKGREIRLARWSLVAGILEVFACEMSAASRCMCLLRGAQQHLRAGYIHRGPARRSTNCRVLR